MKAVVVLVDLGLTANVKPKLAAKVTSAMAIRLYRACAQRALLESAKYESAHQYLVYSGSSPQQAADWMRSIHREAPALPSNPQASNPDRGDRICDAFQQLFQAGATTVVVVCPDVPDMDSTLVANAFAALESSDVAFGPTHDGGCYLVGMNSYHPHLFKEIPWGTNQLLQALVGRVNTLGTTVAPLQSLPVLYNIDTLDSLMKWTELRSSRVSPLWWLANGTVNEYRRLKEALEETGYALVTP